MKNFCYKLIYIDLFSSSTKKRVKHLRKNSKYCFFVLLKLGICFQAKIVYQVAWNPSLFTSLFVQDINPGELVNLNTNEHLVNDKKSHVFIYAKACAMKTVLPYYRFSIFFF